MGSDRPVELHFSEYRSRGFHWRAGTVIKKPGHNGRPYIPRCNKNNTTWGTQFGTQIPPNKKPPRHQKRLALRRRILAGHPRGRNTKTLSHPCHKALLEVNGRIFLALNTNIRSWIQNLERRDMILLESLAENIFGFTGAYARKKQASLAPILTGWKRWIEFNTMSEDNMLAGDHTWSSIWIPINNISSQHA